jgi:hypothetical protein
MISNFSFKKSHLVAIALLFTVVSCNKDDDVQPNIGKNSFLLNEIPLAANDPRHSPKVMLGSKIFNDANLSVSENGQSLVVQSCASCHLEKQGYAGFANTTAVVNKNGATRRFIGGFGEGAVAGKFGGRMPLSAAYASFSPKLYRPDMHDGLPNEENEFFGGNFWDGRATGHRLGLPTAEQAQGPFLNPVEQNHPSSHAVLLKIEQNLNQYYSATPTETLWEQVWGSPLKVSELDPSDPKVQVEYDRLGYSIAAFEASSLVNKFSSKYDTYLNNNKDSKLMTKNEIEGMKLYQRYCNSCHPSEKGKDGQAPIFTDFGFDNIGVPPTTAHPVVGTLPVDLGLGGFLARSNNPAWLPYAEGAKGKFMTPTVRNVAMGELTASGATNRSYMHNGVFTSLEEVVHFYNTRSGKGEGWSKTAPAGADPRKKTTPGFKVWPAPEYPATFNGEIGNMGMNATEELQIVAFMKTLTDK